MKLLKFADMRRLRKEIRALRREVRAMRHELGAVENEVRRFRGDKLDNLITSMQRSAREMLHLSRDL